MLGNFGAFLSLSCALLSADELFGFLVSNQVIGDGNIRFALIIGDDPTKIVYCFLVIIVLRDRKSRKWLAVLTLGGSSVITVNTLCVGYVWL